MMMGFGFMGIITMLLFWGVLIAGAFWLVKSIFPNQAGSSGSERDQPASPREILDHRYARGEITREQYLAMIDDLERTRQ
jgi:putative membrane protein